MKTPALPTNVARLLLLSALLLAAASASAITNVYFTRFEASEGYDYRLPELVGQNGWVCDSASYYGNGLRTNFLGTQAAYVGLVPLVPPDDWISVYQPLSFKPIETGLPLVEFSTVMAIIDSTTTNWDDFLWIAYNSSNAPLFRLDFNNYDWTISYGLGTNDPIDTGVQFTNDVPYDLRIRMDFAHNRWSATLGSALLVTNVPIAGPDQALDLADMDAVWWPYYKNYPGDNFMVFDNYKVTADALPPVRLASLGRDAGGQFLLRLTGPSGSRYAIEASGNLTQWTPLKTNVVTDGYFDYIDSAARTLSKRYYRAREVY